MLELFAVVALGGLVVVALVTVACLCLATAVFWLVTWPLRLLFKGAIWLLVGLVLLPLFLAGALVLGAVILIPLAVIGVPLLLVWLLFALLSPPAVA